MPPLRTRGGWICVSLAGDAHHPIHMDSGIASGILTSANRAATPFVASVIHRRLYLQALGLMRSWNAVSFPCPKHPPWLCFDDDVMVLEKESSFLGIVLFDPRGGTSPLLRHARLSPRSLPRLPYPNGRHVTFAAEERIPPPPSQIRHVSEFRDRDAPLLFESTHHAIALSRRCFESRWTVISSRTRTGGRWNDT